jgi:peptide/nickel transport system permease protein
VVFPGWLALVPGALLVVLLTLLIGGALTLLPAFRTKVSVPLDRLVVGLLEIVGSVPGLVFLLALLTYLERPGLPTVVLVIGLLGWTSIARFVRAELMRIRELPYISAARVGGVGELRLLIVHALPNALGPVAVTAAFVVGGSILLESMLSFLGIGVPAGQVSWGSMLQESRTYPSAWWLAVFPGVLLSLTVLACNSLRR